MNNRFKLLVVLLYCALVPAKGIGQEEVKKDTVRAGIYITSIHDIDFKQKEYTISFWLWLKYKNPDFDFVNNLEVPQAKSVEKSFSTIDTSGGKISLQMKPTSSSLNLSTAGESHHTCPLPCDQR